jgi:hypothetical protein
MLSYMHVLYDRECKSNVNVITSMYRTKYCKNKGSVLKKISSYTAKTKCRKFETNIPRKGISGPQSQFPHSCVCERNIYSHDGSAFLLEEICGPILGLYKSITDTRMWKLGLRPRNSQKRNTVYKQNCRCSVFQTYSIIQYLQYQSRWPSTE